MSDDEVHDVYIVPSSEDDGRFAPLPRPSAARARAPAPAPAPVRMDADEEEVVVVGKRGRRSKLLVLSDDPPVRMDAGAGEGEKKPG